MPEDVRWAARPYDGHAINRPLEPDHELLQVGPGTPGGEYFRRFWQPVALSSQLGDLPVAIRILGEELVVFRDLEGTVGLLHKHCAHRARIPRVSASSNGARHTLLLPRVACTRHRRDDPGDAGRARGQPDPPRDMPGRLSRARAQGAGLRLYGSAGEEGRFSPITTPWTSPATTWCRTRSTRPATGCRRAKTRWTPITASSCTGG